MPDVETKRSSAIVADSIVVPPDALNKVEGEAIRIAAFLSKLKDEEESLRNLVVEDTRGAADLTDRTSAIVALSDAISERWGLLKKPHDEALANLKAVFGPIAKGALAVIEVAKTKFREYTAREEEKARKAAAERQRALDEARKAEEAARQKAQEEANREAVEVFKAEIGRGELTVEEAISIVDEQVAPAEAAAVAAIESSFVPGPVRRVETASGTSSTRKRWTCEVADLAVAAKDLEAAFEFKPGVALGLIRAAADWKALDAAGEEFTRHGIRFFKTTDPVFGRK